MRDYQEEMHQIICENCNKAIPIGGVYMVDLVEGKLYPVCSIECQKEIQEKAKE